VLTPPPFPIAYGTINPSASANGAVTIDFSSCAAANRFRVDMAYEGNGGVLGDQDLVQPVPLDVYDELPYAILIALDLFECPIDLVERA
jgi:hypothetical protein